MFFSCKWIGKGVVLHKWYIFQQDFLPKVEKGGWHFIFPRKRKVQAFQKCKTLFSEMFRKQVTLIFVKKIGIFSKCIGKLQYKIFIRDFLKNRENPEFGIFVRKSCCHQLLNKVEWGGGVPHHNLLLRYLTPLCWSLYLFCFHFKRRNKFSKRNTESQMWDEQNTKYRKLKPSKLF